MGLLTNDLKNYRFGVIKHVQFLFSGHRFCKSLQKCKVQFFPLLLRVLKNSEPF
jgi:hypothetical protein